LEWGRWIIIQMTTGITWRMNLVCATFVKTGEKRMGSERCHIAPLSKGNARRPTTNASFGKRKRNTNGVKTVGVKGGESIVIFARECITGPLVENVH
jgi:hypothetical protein